MDPSWGAVKELSEPPKPPRGVREDETITASSSARFASADEEDEAERVRPGEA